MIRVIVRGKDVFCRSELRARLRETNGYSDGPWEPAVFVSAHERALARLHGERFNWQHIRRTADVRHDENATHDIHLPGDGKPFDVDAVVAKLLIAEVLEAP